MLNARMRQRYPADHSVMVDDRPNLLAAMKSTLRSKLTPVFVRQGQRPRPEAASVDPAPDIVIERIGDLISHNLSDFEEHR